MTQETAVFHLKEKRARRNKLKDKISEGVKAENEEGQPNALVDQVLAVGLQDNGDRKEKKRKKKERKVGAADAIARLAGEDSGLVSITADGVSAIIESSTETEKKKKKRKRDPMEAESMKKKRKKDASITEDLDTSATNTKSDLSLSTYVTASATAGEAEAFLKKHSITIHAPNNVEPSAPIISFEQLDVPLALRASFKDFKEPTPIQACTWPPALKGLDVVGIAETGSGKTLAFGIPALTRLVSHPESSRKKGQSSVNVLVVAPTRELAIQTHDTLSALGKPFGIASVAVFGGVPKEPQIHMLRNMNKDKDGLITRIIVGTPGRILDLMQDGACDLSGVDYLVLDEADRMLDKGFENDIRKIIESTKHSAERQTMMFSATWPEAVRRLAGTFQKNPVRVTVGSDDLTANSKVQQSVDVFDDPRSKDSRLLALLQSLSHKKAKFTGGASESRILVFALYKKEASRVEGTLRRQGYAVGALHGDMNQNARMEALENFKNGTTGLLVATDVAARGLDIPNVGVVINYTFPLTIEDYVHRIGRTGRGGRSGRSITFFTGENHEKALAGELARLLREGGFDYEGLKRFPMTIKKREHSAYGAFFRDDIPMPKGPTKIVF